MKKEKVKAPKHMKRWTLNELKFIETIAGLLPMTQCSKKNDVLIKDYYSDQIETCAKAIGRGPFTTRIKIMQFLEYKGVPVRTWWVDRKKKPVSTTWTQRLKRAN
jgi:hypothetical protein